MHHFVKRERCLNLNLGKMLQDFTRFYKILNIFPFYWPKRRVDVRHRAVGRRDGGDGQHKPGLSGLCRVVPLVLHGVDEGAGPRPVQMPIID